MSIYVEIHNAHKEYPEYDPRTGAHFWIAAAGFRIADPESGKIMLDSENCMSIDVGCWFCEEPFSKRLKHRRCKGEPKS